MADGRIIDPYFGYCPGDTFGELPDELTRLQLPHAVAARLRTPPNLREAGQAFTAGEREEAEGVLAMAEFLTEAMEVSDTA